MLITWYIYNGKLGLSMCVVNMYVFDCYKTKIVSNLHKTMK